MIRSSSLRGHAPLIFITLAILWLVLYSLVASRHTTTDRSRGERLSLEEEEIIRKNKTRTDVRAHIDQLLWPAIDLKGEGALAMCSAVFNEDRFIAEWILYHRMMGVDKFYLYDTGCTDTTLAVLAPWIASGIVKLHAFEHEQGGAYQMAALRHCSAKYAAEVEWLIDCDVDEFYIPTQSFTGMYTTDRPTVAELPFRPLATLLKNNALYTEADAIAVSRVAFKNQGIQRLSGGASVLVSQTLRDVHHTIDWLKLKYTKTIVHTRKKAGWVIPGPHSVQHLTLSPSEINIINVVGERMNVTEGMPGADVPGSIYYGITGRSLEPLTIFHYISRDVDNCLAKRARAAVARKGGWRDRAGNAACLSDEMYQAEPFVELKQRTSFYAASSQDYLLPNSVIGRLMPSLIEQYDILWREHVGRPNTVPVELVPDLP